MQWGEQTCPYLEKWEIRSLARWRLTPGQRVRMKRSQDGSPGPCLQGASGVWHLEPSPPQCPLQPVAQPRPNPAIRASDQGPHSSTRLVLVSLCFPQLLTLSGQEGEERALGSWWDFVFCPRPLPVLPVLSRTRGLSWIWVLAGSLPLNFGEADILVGWKKMKSSQCPYVPCF